MLLISLVIHAIAMVCMALLLIPAMPGVTDASETQRISYVAGHAWAWHLGWLPWHLCALSDLLLSLEFLRTSWAPKRAALATLLLAVMAVISDQLFEIMWDVKGPALAASALKTGNAPLYLDFEKTMYLPIFVIAGSLYALMAFGWSYCLSRSGQWSKFMTWLSVATWSLLFFLNPTPLLPPSLKVSATLLTIGNVIGFVLMEVWFFFALRLVRRMPPPAGSQD